MDTEMQNTLRMKRAAMLGLFMVFVFVPVSLSFNLQCSRRCFSVLFPLLQSIGILGCIAILWWNKRMKTDSVFWYILASGALTLIVTFQIMQFIAS